MKKVLKEIGVGEIFNIAGVDFIKFGEKDGNTIAVAKEIWCDSIFGNNNNFAKSKILDKLNTEFLPKIEKEIGAENIVEHEVDLLSLDGDNKWGKINCKVSIPTFDFCCANVKIFDKYKINKWFWLATPGTTEKHCGNDYWVSCVSPDGNIYGINSRNNCSGVRPFIIFVSSIIVSCGE